MVIVKTDAGIGACHGELLEDVGQDIAAHASYGGDVQYMGAV